MIQCTLKKNMVIKSTGFTIGKFYFPAFSVGMGEYLSIDFPDLFDHTVHKVLCAILSGAKRHESVQLMMDFIPIEPFPTSRFDVFRKTAILKYLETNGGHPNENIVNWLKENNLSPEQNVYRLGISDKKLLALEVAYRKARNIIICTAGLDYTSVDKIKTRILKEQERGSIIEINYPTTKGREYLFDDSTMRLDKLTVVSN